MAAVETSSTPDRISIPAWTILICLSTMIFGIADHGLWTPDEPREAEIGREMSLGTSLIVPRLAQEPFVEKPPLYYWTLAIMMVMLQKIIGTTAAARATSALFAALTLLALWLTTRRYLGRDKALVAVLSLATMAGFFHVGHWIIMDSVLMFFICVAVMLFFIGLDHSSPIPLMVGYLAAGLAFLTKGPVAWSLIALPWALTLGTNIRAIGKRPLRHLAGVVLLVGPAAVWMAAFHSLGGQGAWHEWLIDNQFGRFLGRTFYLGHIKGPLYYLGVLPVVLLPWTPVIAGWIVHREWRDTAHNDATVRNLLRVAVAWSFGGILVLSLASTKREIYLYPLLPGFAILTAASIGRSPRWVRTVLWIFSAVLLVLMAGLAVITPVWTGHSVVPHWGLHPRTAICAGAGLIALTGFRRNFLAGVLTVSGLFYLAAVWSLVPVVDKSKNYGPAVRRFVASIPTEDRNRVCGWDLDETNRAVLPYYGELTVTNVRGTIRLAQILRGQDQRCTLVITQQKRFPPPEIVLPPWKVVTDEQLGSDRKLELITGTQQTERHP